jgi:hypothetical protein
MKIFDFLKAVKETLLPDFHTGHPAVAGVQLAYPIVLMDIKTRYWIPACAPKETLLWYAGMPAWVVSIL